MAAVKLLIADSNELIRLGLKTVFCDAEQYTVVDEAFNSEDLLTKAKITAAEVVLIDYTSPSFDIDAIVKAREVNPNLKFVAITYDQSGNTITNAIKCGVMSYIKKDCDIQEIK
ncbi:MAG: response regulator, partial [Luteibaculum sp.]